ncbi:hypothetical protein N2W49_002488 [Clostridium perfringens]|uniref:hypothetical protein n=1 Tax=Clostridium perfringens TaxID=1502 RepID=UPI001DFC3CAA|nr:hypothetical protein [Clostridium perfringens]EJT6160060.1 hypothetical protein [Clostridium perfringens]MDK0620565.1 hypothetical protein [Clostridium perfringens]
MELRHIEEIYKKFNIKYEVNAKSGSEIEAYEYPSGYTHLAVKTAINTNEIEMK